MNVVEGSQLSKVVLVSEGDVDNTVVSERGHGSDGGGFLSSSLSSSGHEQTSVLAPESSGSPETTSLVPEGLQETYALISITILYVK